MFNCKHISLPTILAPPSYPWYHKINDFGKGLCTQAKYSKIHFDKTQIECHEIEPNLSKDRAMHEEDNPSF
jgi:hypothetical protein